MEIIDLEGHWQPVWSAILATGGLLMWMNMSWWVSWCNELGVLHAQRTEPLSHLLYIRDSHFRSIVGFLIAMSAYRSNFFVIAVLCQCVL